MKIKLEVEVTNSKLARALSVLKRRRVRYALGALMIAIPAAAIASPVTVPNTFQAGQVISASEMNANFDAVKAAVDDNDARVSVIESGWDLPSCSWQITDSTNNEAITADCPVDTHAVRGSCDSTDPSAQLRSFFSRASDGTLPMTGDAGDVAADSFRCRFIDPPATGQTHTARALCCPSSN